MSEKLDVFENVIFDNSITKQEFHTYQPHIASFNNYDEIRISVQNQDIYTAPYLSYIYVAGEVEATDIGAVTLTNNAFAFLFDEIRYELNGVEVDKVRDVGTTSMLKGYASHGRDDSCALQMAGWSPLQPQAIHNYNNGKFFAYIPLSFLLGFAEDYKKIIINIRQELILIRSRSDRNCYKTADENNVVTVKVNKIEWHLPHISVNDNIKLQMMSHLNKDAPIHVPFRKWELHELPALKSSARDIWSVKTSNNLERPRYILVGFQTARRDINNGDVGKFDHENITNMKVYLNADAYPYDNLNLNMQNGNYVLLYQMYANFQKSYYSREKSNPLFDYFQFKNNTIFVFDCSKQNESVKSSTVDLKIEFEATEAFNPNTRAFCLILYDTVIEYTPLSGIVTKLV